MAAAPRRQRIRDHALERERRNLRAKAQGFSSRDALDRARKKGAFPSREQIATDQAQRDRAAIITRERGYAGRNVQPEPKPKRVRRPDYAVAGFDNNADYQAARRQAREWSDRHSRQDVSRYQSTMPPGRFGAYYRAMVAEWGQKRSREWQQNLQHYIVDVAHEMTETEYDQDFGYPGPHTVNG